MCISSKGKGYDPVAVVVEAVEKTGWTPTQFFHNARLFNRQGGVHPAKAEAEFHARATLQGFSFMTTPPVLAFADWILIKEPKEIYRKYSQLS